MFEPLLLLCNLSGSKSKLILRFVGKYECLCDLNVSFVLFVRMGCFVAGNTTGKGMILCNKINLTVVRDVLYNRLNRCMVKWDTGEDHLRDAEILRYF